MIVGCYTVDLYCDNVTTKTCIGNCWSQYQYTECNESRCLKQAKRDGWVISNKNKEGIRETYCPVCKGKRGAVDE